MKKESSKKVLVQQHPSFSVALNKTRHLQGILDGIKLPRLIRWRKRPRLSRVLKILSVYWSKQVIVSRNVAALKAPYKAFEYFFKKKYSKYSRAKLHNLVSRHARALEKAASDPIIRRFKPLKAQLLEAASWYRSLNFQKRIVATKKGRDRAVKMLYKYLNGCMIFDDAAANSIGHPEKTNPQSRICLCKAVASIFSVSSSKLTPQQVKTIIFS